MTVETPTARPRAGREEFPQCPVCHGPIAGANDWKGGRRGSGKLPDGSVGYCMSCHISLAKTGGVWARSSGVPGP